MPAPWVSPILADAERDEVFDDMDAVLYRSIMGHFATGVAVVTTESEGWLHGITVNALASVSLEPLLLLVCIDRQATAHDQIATGGRFAVNLLSEAQEEVSRVFAARGRPEKGRLRGVAFRTGPHGSPLLEGCPAWLECTVAERYPGGDHTVFLGAVVGGAVAAEDRPLLYWRGGYRRLGP